MKTSRSLRPKLRLDFQLVHNLVQTTDVMRQDFAECFIDLRRARLTSQTVAKLRLDHMKRSFDI